jgi:PAS domain S-box-containing protein
LQESATKVGLSADQLSALFPFHFVINREFKLIQLGSSISTKFDAGIRPDAYMDEFFEITTPSSLLNWGYLRSMENEICSIRHKRSQIDFSAKILPCGNDKLIFLLKPLINTSAYLDQIGLETSDFSNHDLVNDLFLHRRQTRVKADINLADALVSQETQLKDIRQLLANQEAESRKLAHIISRSTYWIIIANSHGAIEWVNEAFLKSSGYAQEDVLGNELSMLLDIPSADFAHIQGVLEVEANFRKEIGVIVDNEPKWIDIDIRALFDDRHAIVNLIAIGRDITEQKKAQSLNERLTVELNTIFDLSPDGFVSFDEDGRLSQVNRAFIRMTGLNEEALADIDSEGFEQLINDLNQYDHQAGSGNADLLKIINPKLAIIRRSIKLVPGSGSRNKKAIHYFQDITHEYELSRMKGEFLSAAAHELRTPMASIFGFTDLLINRSYNENQIKEILQNIYRQATRMTKLINDLLDLARIEAKGKLEFKPGVIPVNHLINSAFDEFKVNFKNRVVRISPAEEQLAIKGDFDKLIQVLINLLSNSDKYSRIDTEIIIDTHEKNVDSKFYAGIRVKDFGAGMSKSDLSKLFEPFFRSANTMKVPGTGLGMSIVKEIIELHGGEIEVTSELDAGTEVTIWLPKAD